MYFITIKRMLEVCFSAHPNIQYRAKIENRTAVPVNERSDQLSYFYSENQRNFM